MPWNQNIRLVKIQNGSLAFLSQFQAIIPCLFDTMEFNDDNKFSYDYYLQKCIYSVFVAIAKSVANYRINLSNTNVNVGLICDAIFTAATKPKILDIIASYPMQRF